MGFRTGYVITSVAFLFGVLFIASVYDFPLIYYSPFDPKSADVAEAFYLSAFNGPGAITALLHGMMALGVLGLVAKLHRWSEMAKYFDGSSLGELVAAQTYHGLLLLPQCQVTIASTLTFFPSR